MGLLEKERLDREYAQDAEDRHSRIEARFEELIRREFTAHEMPAHWPTAMGAAWDAAVAVESFLESKRAEVKDEK